MNIIEDNVKINNSNHNNPEKIMPLHIKFEMTKELFYLFSKIELKVEVEMWKSNTSNRDLGENSLYRF